MKLPKFDIFNLKPFKRKEKGGAKQANSYKRSDSDDLTEKIVKKGVKVISSFFEKLSKEDQINFELDLSNDLEIDDLSLEIILQRVSGNSNFDLKRVKHLNLGNSDLNLERNTLILSDYFPNLESLNLSNNGISSCNQLNGFFKLSELILNENEEIKNISEIIKLPKLENLELCNCGLTTEIIKTAIEKLDPEENPSILKNLDLSKNKHIKELPNNIGDLINLNLLIINDIRNFTGRNLSFINKNCEIHCTSFNTRKKLKIKNNAGEKAHSISFNQKISSVIIKSHDPDGLSLLSDSFNIQSSSIQENKSGITHGEIDESDSYSVEEEITEQTSPGSDNYSSISTTADRFLVGNDSDASVNSAPIIPSRVRRVELNTGVDDERSTASAPDRLENNDLHPLIESESEDGSLSSADSSFNFSGDESEDDISIDTDPGDDGSHSIKFRR